MDEHQCKKAVSRIDDLLERCHGSAVGWENTSDYVHWRSSSSMASSTEPGISLKGSIPLPPAFTSLYEHVQSKSFMGLFPPINRAWLTVDTRLFLWEYSPDSMNNVYPTHINHGMMPGMAMGQSNDFHSCELFDQIILAVELVYPRKGVFSDDIKYLVAVATPVEVTLLGVVFSGPEGTGDVRLMPTGYCVATDDVQMTKICSTPDGRVFMAGADGHLHEFVYSADDSRWMLGIFPASARKAYKQVYNTGAFAKILPGYFTRSDELIDIVIDSTRNALYTLSQQGTLSVYDISGGKVKIVRSVGITHESRNLVSVSIPAAEREFVAIIAVSPSVSEKVHLIVITGFGERIYFSTKAANRPSVSRPENVPSIEPPKTLLCVGYRPTPVADSTGPSRTCIHMAWWNHGCLVMADLRERESDRLVLVYPDQRVVKRNRFGSTPTCTEVVYDSVELDCDPEYFGSDVGHTRTFAIGEYTGDLNSNRMYRLGPFEPPQFFWVLTSHRLLLYERVMPLEKLEEALLANNRSSNEVRSLFEQYSGDVICALCLKIAVSNQSLAPAAAQAFYGFAEHRSGKAVESTGNGMDESKEDMPAVKSGDAFNIGRAAMQFALNVEYSDVHQGTFLFVSETLYPIWAVFLTSSRDPNEYQGLAIPRNVLEEVRNQLVGLVSFFERFNPEAMLSEVWRNSMQGGFGFSSQPIDSTNLSDAYRAEATSLFAVKELCSRCAQALGLILLVSQQQLHRIAQQLAPNVRSSLANLRLKEVVSTRDGKLVTQALLNALFSMYPSDSYPKMQIMSQLREECPFFYGTVEESLQQGRSKLREVVQRVQESKARAENGRNSAIMPGWGMNGVGVQYQFSMEHESIVNEAEMAVTALKQAAGSIFDLESIFADLTFVDAPRALIDLALAIGQHHEGSGDPSIAQEAYNAILETLQPIIASSRDLLMEQSATPDTPLNPDADEIRKRQLKDACLQTALTTTSRAFMNMLFDFLSKTSYGEINLLGIRSKEVEEFLKNKKDKNLLWRFYSRQGRYLDAATILLQMSDSEEDAKLAERINLLSVALHNAQAAARADPTGEQLVGEISDYLDVAKVQLCILNELLGSHSGDAPDVQDAKAKLDGRIMDLSTLYNTYAKPLDLFEGSLDVLRCGNYRDDVQVRSIWLQLLKREAEAAAHTPHVIFQKMVTLGKRFYPYKFVFPVKFVIDVLERYVFERMQSNRWAAEPGWPSRLMNTIGVPEGDVFDAYHDIIENSLQRTGIFREPWAWSDESALRHLIDSTVCALRGFKSEKTREKALRVIAQCRARLRSARLQVTEALNELEKELSI